MQLPPLFTPRRARAWQAAAEARADNAAYLARWQQLCREAETAERHMGYMLSSLLLMLLAVLVLGSCAPTRQPYYVPAHRLGAPDPRVKHVEPSPSRIR